MKGLIEISGFFVLLAGVPIYLNNKYIGKSQLNHMKVADSKGLEESLFPLVMRKVPSKAKESLYIDY